jgi:hypothetical protein
VSYDQGLSFMKENSLAFFFETSAKTGTNIENVANSVKTFSLKYLGIHRSRENNFLEIHKYGTFEIEPRQGSKISS